MRQPVYYIGATLDGYTSSRRIRSRWSAPSRRRTAPRTSGSCGGCTLAGSLLDQIVVKTYPRRGRRRNPDGDRMFPAGAVHADPASVVRRRGWGDLAGAVVGTLATSRTSRCARPFSPGRSPSSSTAARAARDQNWSGLRLSPGVRLLVPSGRGPSIVSDHCSPRRRMTAVRPSRHGVAR